MKRSQKLVLRILIALGFASTAYYFSWWFRSDGFSNPLLFLFFLVMLFYLTTQALFLWYVFLYARKPEASVPAPVGEYSVDLFLPTYNEPIELIERTLRASMAVRYPHTTYVLDDGKDGAVEALALSVGARYIRREHPHGNKAGNINHALRCSSADLVAIFDIDHVPQPDFLDRVIPNFGDPHIGVVQVALDHYNGEESYIAAAAGTMNDEFFAATMHGMDSMGCAMVFGSNAVFRRSALVSLGGYKKGLAEDLSTSMHLHAAGWKSAYVPELLAKGLLPPDLDAFCKRQFKWSRGVFDVLFRELRSTFPRLTGMQRICYMIRMTYYLAGPVIGIHVLFAILAPLFLPRVNWLDGYVISAVPFLISFATIHAYANHLFALRPVSTPGDMRGHLVILASWPIYTLALFSSLFGTRARFVATPKSSSGEWPLAFIVPQFVAVVLLMTSLFAHVSGAASINWEYVTLAGTLIFMHFAAAPAKTIRESYSESPVREFEPFSPQRTTL